jgi:signal transduction histidine kinase
MLHLTIAMKEVNASFLKSIDILKDVPEDQLNWFLDNSKQYIVKEGDFLFKEDDPIIGTHILVDGAFKVYFLQGKGMKEVGIFESKEISGYLPYSRGKIAGAFAQALRDTQMITFPIEKTREMINQHFELTQALVHVMTNRVKQFAEYTQQNEKMMALGKLSAGLAHELNNPSSAIVRGADMLKKHLQLQPETFKKVMEIQVTPAEVDIVNNKMFAVLSQPKPVLTLMERTDKEDELTDWLDQHQVENSFDVAENFVEYGFTVEVMEDFASHIPSTYISPVFNWINNNLITDKMVSDIQDASERISELVKSVKNFTHMDRGNDMQYADIHIGIRSTVTMLNHKIKKSSIRLIENFDQSLPEVKAYIGELNQVWTNIIDNAIDALEETENGTLEIKTEKDGEFVKVSFIDNGPGIPDDIKNQIFDPFFTTKEIGKGTGLGLEVVKRIIKQHNGSIKVNSEPGKTEFILCFPLNG